MSRNVQFSMNWSSRRRCARGIGFLDRTEVRTLLGSLAHLGARLVDPLVDPLVDLSRRTRQRDPRYT